MAVTLLTVFAAVLVSTTNSGEPSGDSSGQTSVGLVGGWQSSWNRANYHRGSRSSTDSTGRPASPTTAPSSTSVVTDPSTGSPASTATPPPTTTSRSLAPATPPAAGGPVTPATGCAASPSRCGYPDASNTGVKAGTALRSVPGDLTQGPGWHWDSRGWLTVDGDGAVLDGMSVPANVDVTASNVNLRNLRITTSGDGFGVSLRHANNVVIEDSEILGGDTSTNRLMVAIKDIYGDSQGTQVLRNNISHASTGVQMDRGLIQDNYIHDLGLTGGDHVNGTTSNGGTDPLTIRHNTVFNQFDQTDAISLFQDFGPQANRTIDNNLVGGGGYTIYGGANPGGTATSNIRITNNRFATSFFAGSGYFGRVTAFNPQGPGNVWSGNIWDSGQALAY